MIEICTEMPQGSSVYSYLKHTKMSFYFFLQNQKTGRRNSYCLQSWYEWDKGGGGEKMWEGEYGASIVYKKL
jgi:hypothetical protein